MVKRSYLIILITVITFFTFCEGTFAQRGKRGFAPPGMDQGPDFPVRAFLNKFSVNLSSGYGRTFYHHQPDNYKIFGGNNELFLSMGDTTGGYYQNWLDQPSFVNDTSSLGNPLGTDSTQLGLKGIGKNVPVNLTIYYNLHRVRIGGGAGIIFHNPGELTLENSPEVQSKYNFARDKHIFFNYYGLLGLSIYEYYDWAFGADVRAGIMKMGKGFDKANIDRSITVNAGISIEKVFSEYFRVFLRPSYEFKNYTINLPQSNQTMEVNDPAVFVELGVSINYPEIPMSPIPNDEVRMKHRIDGVEVRGMPFYKKQNPKYGELYPELQRDKRKGESNRHVRKKGFKAWFKSWFPF